MVKARVRIDLNSTSDEWLTIEKLMEAYPTTEERQRLLCFADLSTGATSLDAEGLDVALDLPHPTDNEAFVIVLG